MRRRPIEESVAQFLTFVRRFGPWIAAVYFGLLVLVVVMLVIVYA